MITIFMVDDHQIFRDGLRLLIDSTDDMMVIGEAASGAEALQKLATLQPGLILPNLILMDIQMPGENGIDVTRQIKQRHPDSTVLMLTMFEDDQSVFAAMRAGAIGYVLKGIQHEQMLQTVRIAAAGGAVFSPSIARQMMRWFDQLPNQPLSSTNSSTVELPDLTHREREVLVLLANGDDNPTIAEKLTLTGKSVRNYVSQVLKKLAVSDRYAAASKAHQAGIV